MSFNILWKFTDKLSNNISVHNIRCETLLSKFRFYISSGALFKQLWMSSKYFSFSLKYIWSSFATLLLRGVATKTFTLFLNIVWKFPEQTGTKYCKDNTFRFQFRKWNQAWLWDPERRDRKLKNSVNTSIFNADLS